MGFGFTWYRAAICLPQKSIPDSQIETSSAEPPTGDDSTVDISNRADGLTRSTALEKPYSSIAFPLIVAMAMVAFVALNLVNLNQPGIYMDSVNPDYEAVRVVNPSAPVTVWYIPGNMLFDRFPVLQGLYDGSLPVYWILPFYALMGGTILSIRVAHLCIGLVILALVAMLSRQGSRLPLVAGLAVLLLTIDPAFTFVWRAHAWLCVFPSIFLLSAMAVMYRRPRPQGYLIAGILAGLSPVGHFLYFFTWPGLLIFALLDRAVLERAKSVALFIVGLSLGILPYFVGYALLFHALGLHGGLAWIQSIAGSLKIDSGQTDYSSRVASVLHQLWLVFTNEWQWLTFWAIGTPDISQAVKTLLLFLFPALALSLSLRYMSFDRSFSLVALPTASFVIVSTFLGQRLGGHEFTFLVPLLYILVAISVSALLERFPNRRNVWALLVVALVVGTINLNATAVMAAKLGSDGGVGLWSSVISDYPKTALARHDATPHIFWSWGAMMPFIYETNGTIPAYDNSDIKGVTCRYRHAKVVLLGKDVNSDDFEIAIKQAGLRSVGQEIITDRHSGFPYEIVSIAPAPRACEDNSNIVSIAPSAGADKTQQSASRPAAPSTVQYPTGVLADPAGISEIRGIFAGTYPSSSCCFLSREVWFDVYAGPSARSIQLQLYVPTFDPWKSNPGTITILDSKGKATATRVLFVGSQSVNLPLSHDAILGGVARIHIRMSGAYVPKTAGISNDPRLLSGILLSVSAN